MLRTLASGVPNAPTAPRSHLFLTIGPPYCFIVSFESNDDRKHQTAFCLYLLLMLSASHNLCMLFVLMLFIEHIFSLFSMYYNYPFEKMEANESVNLKIIYFRNWKHDVL